MHPSKSGWYPRAGCAASGARQRAVLHGNPEPKGKRESEGIVLRAQRARRKESAVRTGAAKAALVVERQAIQGKMNTVSGAERHG